MKKSTKKLMASVFLSCTYALKYRLYRGSSNGDGLDYSEWFDGHTDGQKFYAQETWLPVGQITVPNARSTKNLLIEYTKKNHPDWFYSDFQWGINHPDRIKLNRSHPWMKNKETTNDAGR